MADSSAYVKDIEADPYSSAMRFVMHGLRLADMYAGSMNDRENNIITALSWVVKAADPPSYDIKEGHNG